MKRVTARVGLSLVQTITNTMPENDQTSLSAAIGSINDRTVNAVCSRVLLSEHLGYLPFRAFWWRRFYHNWVIFHNVRGIRRLFFNLSARACTSLENYLKVTFALPGDAE